MLVDGKHYRTVWMDGSSVVMIDQPKIPHEFGLVRLENHKETAESIRTMVTRGAGAIGATAGYGMAQGVLEAPAGDLPSFMQYVNKAAETIRGTRPTAQNLFYAVDRVLDAIDGIEDPKEAKLLAVEEAQKIADEDAESCRLIGLHGERLIKDGARVLTHCNAGWLAFVDWGSALSPVYTAVTKGKRVFVYADETRPRCQGARLTAFELVQQGVEHAIIPDNAAGALMQAGEIDIVITGADRIAANGDTANKIGTYKLAVLAKENGIPFYIAAPTSTIDFGCPDGSGIPIEERCEDEVLYMWGWSDSGRFERVRISPKESKARNIAFDVTPARYIKGIITEKGIVPATVEGIGSLKK